MDLRWQQDTFQVVREYLVLAHEHWPSTSMDAPDDVFVLNDRLEEVAGGCRMSSFGRPSRSLLRPLAHLRLRSGSNGSTGFVRDFTLLLIRIVTGRRHQIRVQLASRGHPVVGDGRYGSGYSDFTFCPRLFLHRHRLSFHCGEPVSSVSVTEQLPEDLRHVLDGMELMEPMEGSRAPHRNGSIADIASALPSLYGEATKSPAKNDTQRYTMINNDKQVHWMHWYVRLWVEKRWKQSGSHWKLCRIIQGLRRSSQPKALLKDGTIWQRREKN